MNDTHIVFDLKTMNELKRLAKAEDSTIVRMVRVLVREALSARGARP